MQARRRVLVALALGLAPVLGAWPGSPVAPASAACGGSPSIDQAVAEGAVVFVGTVVFLENDDHWATVIVEERWHAASALGETVEVHGAGDPGLQTAVDRSYELRRYLFVTRPAGAFLTDDACSATTPWSDDLAGRRPGGVQPYPGLAVATPFADINMDLALPLAALFGLLLIIVIAYIVILRSRRRPPDWMR